MKVLVDTSVWSLILRTGQKKNKGLNAELSELIDEVRVVIMGPIRQEILSGIKLTRQYEELRSYLSVFPDLELETDDFEQAAEFYNLCRGKGIQGSNTDFLICSVALNHELEIFTRDKDFKNYKKHIPIKLYPTRFV